MRLMDSLRGLVNDLSGLGGVRDKGSAAYARWLFTPLSSGEAENAYRGSWMARKAVDIPAYDMLREGIAWQGDDNVIEAIELAMRKFKVVTRVMKAVSWGRLYGGGLILLHDGNDDTMQPLNVTGKDQLKWIMPLTRYELTVEELDTNPLSEGYMEPAYYTVQSKVIGTVRVHPSRVVKFLGKPIPRQVANTNYLWSDSILDSVDQAIRDATGAQQGIAALVQEAKVDVIKIDGFMSQIGSLKYRNAILERNHLAMIAKSTTNALILDKTDEYVQKTANFSQLPEVERLFLQVVSGAVDIPVTRFLGQSPSGMNSTGESDMRNYYDRISTDQELFFRDPFEQVLVPLVISTLGAWPKDLNFTFNPLWQMSETEKATVDKTRADTFKVLTDTGLQPREVLQKAQENQMIESETFPGFEQAMDGYIAEFGEIEFPDPVEEAQQQEAPVEDARFSDATPRSLYVRRDVINSNDIVRWARKQGFTDIVPDLHVTVMYSRTAVDWMKTGESWSSEMKINAGGPRLIETFNDAAVVLLFNASELRWRHSMLLEAGAEFDYSEYQPHITITYNSGNLDLSTVEPYQGEIVLGPEIFEEIKG